MSACIWLHEEALSLSHPVFQAAPENTPAIFIWDEAYLRAQQYSLKRLVFIDECVADLGILAVDTPCGLGTADWLKLSEYQTIYIPASVNPWINTIIAEVKLHKTVHVVSAPLAFPIDSTVNFNKEHPKEYRRFYAYWRQLEKNLFAH